MRSCHVRRTSSRAAWWLAVVMIAAAGVQGCTSTPTQQSTSEAIEDGVVTARIKSALVADPLTKAHQINVETIKGRVQLSGFVETEDARNRALQLARQIEGAKKVTDAMQVRKNSS